MVIIIIQTVIFVHIEKHGSIQFTMIKSDVIIATLQFNHIVFEECKKDRM